MAGDRQLRSHVLWVEIDGVVGTFAAAESPSAKKLPNLPRGPATGGPSRPLQQLLSLARHFLIFGYSFLNPENQSIILAWDGNGCMKRANSAPCCSKSGSAVPASSALSPSLPASPSSPSPASRCQVVACLSGICFRPVDLIPAKSVQPSRHLSRREAESVRAFWRTPGPSDRTKRRTIEGRPYHRQTPSSDRAPHPASSRASKRPTLTSARWHGSARHPFPDAHKCALAAAASPIPH